MKKNSLMQWCVRIAVYIVGLFVLAMGVAVSVNSNLGVSPVSSLPYVISQISGVVMGNCVIAVFCTYILMQFLILRRKFNPINLCQIVFSTIFGYFVDFAKMLLGDFAIPTYAGQLTMLAVSVVLVGAGVFLYVEAGLVPMPMEGLSMTVADKLKVPFPTMKIVVDCIVVGVGILLSFVFLGRLDGIREGTVVTAIVAGKIVGVLRRKFSPVIQAMYAKVK